MTFRDVQLLSTRDVDAIMALGGPLYRVARNRITASLQLYFW
jgi:hypothetical protein